MDNIHKVGAEAVKALRALRKANINREKALDKYGKLLQERNEELKPMLVEVRDAIAAGGSVNGCSSWEAWAKFANWSKRGLNYIINGRKSGNKRSRSVVLKDGMKVTVIRHGGGKKYEMTLDDRLLMLLIEHGAETPEEEHTGQHESCEECWEVIQAEDTLKLKRSAAWDIFIKRIQPLINTWRNGRLKHESEYRRKFDLAATQYHKKIGADALPVIKDARDRMEAAIADRNKRQPYLMEQNTAVKELAETLDSLPPTPVNDCRDYSMEDVKALFEETN